MPALLEVKDLTVEFQGDRGTRKVLDGVDLQVRDGETLGIVGESGSGKSVLLTTIMGLLPPPWRVTAGQVRLQGRELLDPQRTGAWHDPRPGTRSGAGKSAPASQSNSADRAAAHQRVARASAATSRRSRGTGR